MSDIKEALVHSENNAISAITKTQELAKFPIAVLPKSMDVRSLEQYQEHRNQFRGELRTESIKDFVSYANEQPGGICFVDRQNMIAGTFFDIGDTDKPGHCQHRSIISLRISAAFEQFINMDGRRVDQQSLAEFLEDWREEIKVWVSDQDDSLDINKAIAAVRRVTVTKETESDHQVQTFSANKSAMEKLNATSGGDDLPGFLCFSCIPYFGLGEFTVNMRISLIITGGEPVFMLRAIKLEEEREAMSDEFHGKIASGLNDTVKTYMGSFNPDGGRGY